jgi:hypothetical protein
MRVWDVSPGYLNDQELLAQRQWVMTLLANRGEAPNQGEESTRRWTHCLNALRCVEAWLHAECRLRALADPSPATVSLLAPLNLVWPKLNTPAAMFSQLQADANRAPGRIPLPLSTQSLWTQHKYSVAARSIAAYREISVKVAASRGRDNFDWLAGEVFNQMRLRPEHQSLHDALLQMWGYVAAAGAVGSHLFDDLPALFAEIQRRAVAQNITYLVHATALSELSVWLESP